MVREKQALGVILVCKNQEISIKRRYYRAAAEGVGK